MLVERQVGDQGFQLAILFAQLLKLAQLVRGKPSVFPLPTVKRLLGHALFPANIAGLLPRLDLPQGQDDLLFGMPFPWHSSSPRFRSEDHSRRRSQLFRGLIFGLWVKRQVCRGLATGRTCGNFLGIHSEIVSYVAAMRSTRFRISRAERVTC